ncbi:MAG: DUF4179 domain-containing protein [Clostridia bacterium]|nr:DUF4179 domain-containing protein [Clostridia bacterium]
MRKSLYNEINRIQTVEQPLFDVDKERIMNQLKKETKSKRPVFIVLKSLSAVAACFVLLITACAFSPVLAQNIPFMQEIVRFLKQEQFPRNGIIASSNVENYMQPAGDTTEDEMQIMEVYCDGTALVMTVGLELPNMDESILRIDPKAAVDINGERFFPEADGAPANLFQFFRTEEGDFVGAASLDVSSLNLTEDFTVTLTLAELTGVDLKLWVANMEEPDIYEPKTYALENPTIPHTISVPVDTSLCKEYSVEKSVQDFTVHKIITTPVCTYVDTERSEYDSYYFTLTTDDGTELSINTFDNPDYTGFHPNYYYEALPEGTKKVFVTVYPWEDDTAPIGIVEIPVEFGYASGIEDYTVRHISEDEIVFDPPKAEHTAFEPRTGEETFQLGETITTQAYRDVYRDQKTGYHLYVNPDAKQVVTYTNMQVFDSPADIGLTESDMRDTRQPLTRDGYKFVTFDVAIENHGITGLLGEDLQKEIEAYEKKDTTTGIMWISDFAMPMACDLDPSAIETEVAYFSGHMNGAANYYHFASNKEDSHSFVVGFYVPDKFVESGEWMVGINTGERLPEDRDDFLGTTKYTYYDIPPVSLSE